MHWSRLSVPSYWSRLTEALYAGGIASAVKLFDGYKFEIADSAVPDGVGSS
jgi:hypothetical protein